MSECLTTAEPLQFDSITGKPPIGGYRGTGLSFGAAGLSFFLISAG